MTGEGLVEASMMIWPHGGEITSPYGWRTHPVTGERKYHSGVDIGAEVGDPVVAVADGVISYAGWATGYGNLVEVNHGVGIETLYGHNSALLVSEGTPVRQGQVIALAGSTGMSTGPHVHFEVQLNEVPVDPLEYLDGTLPLDPGVTVDGNGFPIFGPNSDTMEYGINFDAYIDFAKPIRDLITEFGQKCATGMQIIREDVKWLFAALIVIDLALSAMFNMFEDDWEPINWLFKRFLKYGFILFLILHWGDLIANNVRDYFVYTGATIAGTDYNAVAQTLSDPTYIVQRGAFLVNPIFSYLQNFSGVKILIGTNVIEAFVALALAIGILACFILIGIYITLAYLEFYIVATLSVVTLGFAGSEHTKFLAEKGIGALIGVSIKLMIFSILGTMISTVVQITGGVEYTMLNYLKILISSLGLTFMAIKVSGTCTKLLGGLSAKL